jgi:hypothetical protein
MIVLYIQPNTPSELLFENLDKLLSSVPSDSVPTFVCGDFNVNLRSGDSSVRILTSEVNGSTQLSLTALQDEHENGLNNEQESLTNVQSSKKRFT